MRIHRGLRGKGKPGRTKNFLVFLVFVCIAAVFWFILALNDYTQASFYVKVRVDHVPDSVTFISPVPERLHVVARDRGGVLLQHAVSGNDLLVLDFEQLSDGNLMRVSKPSLAASLRRLFGTNTTISSVTPDSINLLFTRKPGRRVPVELSYDATAVPGMVVMPKPSLSDKAVMLYSIQRSDTVRRLYTENLVLRNLDKSVTVDVPVAVPSGMRAIPSSVKVTFEVEQLVRKEIEIPVTADKLPPGRDILFFPSRVKVAYYVPISYYNQPDTDLKAVASFGDAVASSTDKVGLRIAGKASYMSNLELLSDSVEYSLVSGN